MVSESTLDSTASTTPQSHRVRERQLSFEVHGEERPMDKRMSMKDMQLAAKFMSMNNVCCLGIMAMQMSYDENGQLINQKRKLLMSGTGILVRYSKEDDSGVILTAYHVMENLERCSPVVYLSFDYDDDSTLPNLTHYLGEVLESDPSSDYIFVTMYRNDHFESTPVEMESFEHIQSHVEFDDAFWKKEQRLLLIGHSQSSVKSAEIAVTENGLMKDLR